MPLKTEESKVFAGNFSKQLKQGQYQNKPSNKSQGNNNDKYTFCGY